MDGDNGWRSPCWDTHEGIFGDFDLALMTKSVAKRKAKDGFGRAAASCLKACDRLTFSGSRRMKKASWTEFVLMPS